MNIADLSVAALTLAIDAGVRGMLLLAAVAGLLAVFRVRRAADQLRVWRVAIAAMLVLPAATLLLPQLRVSTPLPQTFAVTIVVADETADSGPDGIGGLEAGMSTIPWTQTLSAWGFITYATGLVVLAVAGLPGRLRGRRLVQNATTIHTASLRIAAADQASRLGLRGIPRLAETSGLRIPIASGVIRPVVVLPDSWREWNTAVLQAVLLHELSHVQRRDALTVWLALVTRTIFWPNPLVWWMTNRIIRLAEDASDEATLAAGVDRVGYAEALSGFMSIAGREPLRTHLAVARPGHAEQRIQRVLEWRRTGAMSRTASALLVTMIAIAGGAVAVLRPEPILAEAPLTPTRALPAPDIARPITVDTSEITATLTRLMRTAEPVRQAQQMPTPSAPDRTWNHLIPNDDWTGKALPAGTPGLTAPRLIRNVIPRYTSDAMRAKIQGEVVIQAIVDQTGVVSEARVIGALHPDLDETALAAIRQWSFSPGMRDGKAETVWIVTALQFRLH